MHLFEKIAHIAPVNVTRTENTPTSKPFLLTSTQGWLGHTQIFKVELQVCTCSQVHPFLLSGREVSAFYIRALNKIDVLKEQANFSFTTTLRFHFCGRPTVYQCSAV